MHKYMAISVISLKEQLTWRADVISNILINISKMAFAYLLWHVIFKSETVIGGFSFQGILTYYVLNIFLTQLDMSASVSEEISLRIRNGTFSKYLVLPMHIELYFIAKLIGRILFYLFFDILIALLWIILLGIDVTLEQNSITSAVTMFMLGLLFMIQLNFYLGILTLKYEEISTFLMIKNNIIPLITGSMIPIVLFPRQVIMLMQLLPFYYCTYLPSMLLTGQCQEEAVYGVIIISCWSLAMQLLINYTWGKYCRKYDGVGI